jgi:hypothetical protein
MNDMLFPTRPPHLAPRNCFSAHASLAFANCFKGMNDEATSTAEELTAWIGAWNFFMGRIVFDYERR